MSLNDLKAISIDPEKTAAALVFEDLMLSPYSVSDRGVAEEIADFYDQSIVKVTPDDITISNGTTGANGMVFQALLSPGDHVISTFPAYSGIVDVPRAMGAEISFLKLEEKKEWQVDVDELKGLLKPTTKMIILNNPHNPTGAVISTSKQAEIVKLAAERDIIVFCDEIFRPLFHTVAKPLSMLEHSNYDKIVVTGSLSKAWGFPGIRIGWMATRNAELRKKLFRIREWMLQDVSVVDKIIAKEILGERCNSNIMAKNVGYAKENLKSLASLMSAHKDTISCCVPPGGATAFVRFLSPGVNGSHATPVDDVEFCERLLEEKGLLLTPASLAFGPDKEGSIKGYTRVHITIPPEQFKKVVVTVDEFLRSTKSRSQVSRL